MKTALVPTFVVGVLTLAVALTLTPFVQVVQAAPADRRISNKGYTLSDLQPSLVVNTFVQPDKAMISAKIYNKRLRLGDAVPEVEPVYLYLPEKKSELKKWLTSVARKNQKKPLIAEFFKQFDKGAYVASRGWLKVAINGKLHRYVAPRKIARKFKKPHLKVFLDGEQLARNPALSRRLISQVRPFASGKQLRSLKAQIKERKLISVSRALFPRFARKNLKKFTPYQGPNCFHAALSFHSETYGLSKRFNVKKERNHHNLMINYDELYRILFLDFREINPRKEDMKFGDIIVFFDRDTEPSRKKFYFKWMKHTLVYLFNNYTFSKGSKSANTPYTVKTLAKEWRTWQRLTGNLRLKVFRRKPTAVLQHADNIATGWVN